MRCSLGVCLGRERNETVLFLFTAIKISNNNSMGFIYFGINSNNHDYHLNMNFSFFFVLFNSFISEEIPLVLTAGGEMVASFLSFSFL